MVVPMRRSGRSVVKMPSQNLMGMIEIVAVRKGAEPGEHFVPKKVNIRIERDLPMEPALGKQEMERCVRGRDGRSNRPPERHPPPRQMRQQAGGPPKRINLQYLPLATTRIALRIVGRKIGG